ncbi:hypothetical protein C8F01DRAFT_1255701 [Mycena amicta]|nr:hypothetical protein C8F01DRAFT_1255701 [Mycena amicta]
MSSASSASSFTITSSSSSQKDYSAAFATLQSTYGLGGMAPSVVSNAPAPGSRMSSYESAFGALSSKFGTAASSVSKLPGV